MKIVYLTLFLYASVHQHTSTCYQTAQFHTKDWTSSLGLPTGACLKTLYLPGLAGYNRHTDWQKKCFSQVHKGYQSYPSFVGQAPPPLVYLLGSMRPMRYILIPLLLYFLVFYVILFSIVCKNVKNLRFIYVFCVLFIPVLTEM